MNVVFFHGLESPLTDGVPSGTKARFLRGRFGARTPAFDNRAAIEFIARAMRGDAVTTADRDAAFAGPLATARENLDGVDVAVASSFGAALLLEALHERAAAGTANPAAVLLAGAGPKLFGRTALPRGLRVALIHAPADGIVPVQGSIDLAAAPTAALLLVDDDHRLKTTVGPTLERAIRWAAGETPRGHLVAGVTLRPEAPGDADAIRAVHRAAFPGPDEAAMVDAVRGTDDLVRSLVAEQGGRIVGHAAWLRVHIGDHVGVGLAPLAVHPDAQGRRIGAALALAGQDACRARGERFAVVLGDPDYYAGLGWSRASVRGIGNEYGADAAFQAMELQPGGLDGVTGLARYPAVLATLGV